ncbi:MAG: TIR domain-containing protein [Candidatus Marithrix sp.]
MTTKDLFISYGRRESLSFVGRLHQQLKLAGYDGWFDKVNIPDGDDYAQRINQGIKSAHNFVYVMALRCMTSPYCLIELEYAKFLGKRVIPIDQMVIFDTKSQELSNADKQVLVDFYKFYNQDNPNIQTTQDVLNRSHKLLGKKDWLDGKEELSDEDCKSLADWAKPYANNWAKHDDLDYLKSFEFPVFGKNIDALDGVIESIVAVIKRQQDYVQLHTEILTNVLNWQQNQKATQHLLVGKERTAAEEWLLTDFLSPKQPPCVPSALVCEFICEARKNAENMMTDIFICYDTEDKEIRDSVIRSLSNHAKTTWTHDNDIQKSDNYKDSIEQGIETADNFFYFISPHSVVSEYCQKELNHALKYNKRIVPLLIIETPETEIPESVRYLQYVDFTDNTCQADYDSDIDDILNILRHEQEYYKQHKILLVRALKWQTEDYKSSFLLRGHNLDNAKTWLRLNDKRDQHLPLDLHKDLITASEAAKGQLGTEVFVSYSRKDADFARHLNTSLQEAGKTTWFDQESISTGVDFEKEIYKGIDGSDNFVFVISPDAVSSEYCEREVNYASEKNKRFISVLFREVEPETMPEALRKINWIDFKDTEFDKSFPELIQAIELDRKHAHQHTVLQQRAGDWVENNRSGDFLLNITACDNAETWRDMALEEKKQPALTELQDGFIGKSRGAIQKANRRRNILFSFVGLLAVLAVIMAGFAFVQMNKAEKAKVKYKQQAQIALIEKLGAQSIVATESPSESNGSYEHAVLLAIQAFNEKDTITSRSNILRVFQAKKYKKVFLYGHSSDVNSIAFSPDGQIIASAGEDETVRFWDVKTQKTLGKPLIGHSSAVTSIAFSPDGQILASASEDKTIRLWNVKTQKSLGEPLTGHSSIVISVAFNPDGQILASAESESKTVRLWNVKTQKSLGEINHSSDVTSVTFSPDGQILALAGIDVRLWDFKTKTTLGEPLIGFNFVISVVFSPNGQILASGSIDKTIRLWDVKTQKLLGEPLIGHSNWVTSVAFSPNSQILASASKDKTVRLWDVKTQKTLGEPLIGHSSNIYDIAFSPDGQTIVSVSSDKTVRLWDIKTQMSKPLIGHLSDVNSVAFSQNGKILASAGYDKTVRLWDVKTQKPMDEPLIGHSDSVNSVVFSSDDRILASASSDKTVRLWNVKTQKLLGEPLIGHSSDVYSVAFSPNSQILASASADRTVRLWDVKTQKTLGEPLTGHSDSVRSVAFNPNGEILASASKDKTVRLWDVKTQKTLGEPLIGHSDSVRSVVFSPDGQILASASYDKTVRLWDVRTQKSMGEPLTGHSDYVNSVAFSLNGQILASASDDNTVILWDIKTQMPLGEPLISHFAPVYSVAFSPDGQILASASLDRTVKLWEVDLNSWKQQICTIVNRNLSHKEWRKYMGDRPHEKTCPNLPKDTLGAIKLTQEAIQLLKDGSNKKEAKEKFAKAREWDANVVYGDEGL